MKWGIIVLLFLGLVAALSASVLVGAIKLDFFSRGKAPKTVTVVVAAKDLPAATIITPECLEKKTLPLAELSATKLAEGLAGQAVSIGRVLGMGVVKDTILTEACYLPRGSSQELLAKIPQGKQAFTVSLRSGIPDLSLLRPGSLVDVWSITKLPRDRGGKAVATLLLSKILVLVVQGEMIEPNPKDEGAGPGSRRSSGAVNVTLMVDPNQVAGLQLVQSEGTIGLSLRNPSDPDRPAPVPMTFDFGGGVVPVTPYDIQSKQDNEGQNGGASSPVGDPNATGDPNEAKVPLVPVHRASPPRNRSRRVIIHRGNKTEEETVDESKTEEDNASGEVSP